MLANPHNIQHWIMIGSEFRKDSNEVPDAMLSRKVSTVNFLQPVPITDTRGQGEYPKMIEITIAKELCKNAP